MGLAVKVDVNKFPHLAQGLHDAAAGVVRDTVESIAADMRRRASTRIEETIEVHHEGTAAGKWGNGSGRGTLIRNGSLTGEVTAGDQSGAFHAGFEEFGTVGRAANPFAVPAAEAHRAAFASKVAQRVSSEFRKGTGG